MVTSYKSRTFRINLLRETMSISRKPRKYAIMTEIIGSGDIYHTFLATGVGSRIFQFCIVQFQKYEDAKIWFSEHSTLWLPVCRLDTESLGKIREMIYENPQVEIPEIPEIIEIKEDVIERDDITPRKLKFIE